MNKPMPASPLTMESPLVRRLLIAFACLHIGLLVILPFASVFWQACCHGMATFTNLLASRDTRAAISLTLQITAIVIPVNCLFGVLLAWGLTHVRIPGKRFILTLLDLPFSVSPVVVGLLFILLFGSNGYMGNFLKSHHIKIIFAFPGLLLVTLFVTMPFVIKELVPLMGDKDNGQEEAARLLGGSWWRIFWKITFPDIKWGLLYGIILCTARAIGEFGAVAVVSGSIRGRTNTLPLHIEALFQDGDLPAASAAASLLALLGIVSLIARCIADNIRKRAEEQRRGISQPLQ